MNPRAIGKGVGALWLCLAASSCIEWHEMPLPAPLSPIATSPSRSTLLAGFGRADITPPPGVGLAGNGPEGRRAAGYRLRLRVSALVLEDANGERIAFAVADLPHVSTNLHRLVAARIVGETGIGADRLVLSATHTHSGPGHFYAERQYNQNSSQVVGYDPAVVEFLVEGTSAAVLAAFHGRRPARIAWGSAPIWGNTRNRSLDAFRRNGVPIPPDPAWVTDEQRAVNPTWTMLRVDLQHPGEAEYRPAGAFSVFAIHGTGNDPHTDLLDSDIHGLVARGLERAIDAAEHRRRHPNTPYQPSFDTRAVHLFANGNEGDVSPTWPRSARCNAPKLRPGGLSRGPRAADYLWAWTDDTVAVARCISEARRFTEFVGTALASSADSMFRALNSRLVSEVRINRAFNTLWLKGYRGLCAEPLTGTSTAGGAEDGRTRLYQYHFLGILRVGLEEGGSAEQSPRGCQGAKKIFLDGIQRRVLGAHGFAEVAQLGVIRVGGLVLGTVPAEVTTQAGKEMREAIAVGLSGQANVDVVALVGLANGFLQYVTTEAEYSAQHYEGGSTLYGPRSALVLADELGRLARSLNQSGQQSPPAEVTPIVAYPGAPREILARRYAGPEESNVQRKLLSFVCQRDTLTARWSDAPPGKLWPADGQVLEIQRNVEGQWQVNAWDDDPTVEVRSIGAKGKVVWVWEVKKSAVQGPAEYRIVWRARADLKELIAHGSCP